ncbi:MAG: phosphoribosyltransferase family protein [Acidimicrobiia bacterium]
MTTTPGGSDRSELRQQLVAIIRRDGLETRDEPFQLTSGAWSRDYIDGKRALAAGADLALAARAALEALTDAGVEHFDAAGGLTMGADHLSHAIAVVSGARWFSVRKKAKGHGKGQAVEGAVLEPGMAVLLVDDVVTTGGSIQQAFHAVGDTGVDVVAALTLVDRGEVAPAFFADRGVTYVPLATYRDLGIDPVA